jgi:hypothetical protein
MKLDEKIWTVQDNALRAWKIAHRLNELGSPISEDIHKHLERALWRAAYDARTYALDQSLERDYTDNRKGSVITHGARGIVHQGSTHGCGICDKDQEKA